MTAYNEGSGDYLYERRRMRRRVTLWRALAFVAIVAAIAIAGARIASNRPFGPQIARVTINGLITGDRATLDLLKRVAASSASAVIISISSPGGTTTGSDALYEEIRRLAQKKPVVAVVGDMAASGAYITALGADRIFAPGNALVGSIGVLFEYPNFYKLMDTVGIALEEVKSSPLKAAPNGFSPTSPEARAALAALVSDSYAWFKSLVKERRNMTDDELAVVSDGRVFTARQAAPLKLIDQIGGESDAIAWLENNKGIAKDLPVRDWTRSANSPMGILGFSARVADLLGFPTVALILRESESEQAIDKLDGLLAVWQAGPGH